MRNKIGKYFFKEFIYIFILILVSISVIVWVVQAVNYLDFVTEDGHTFYTYFYYSILNLPKIVSRMIPFAFLISMLITISKFDKNNELLIFWTSGLNKIRIVNLIFLISILITLFQLILATSFTPFALNSARSILKSSDIGLFPSLLKEKKFNDTVSDLTVFIEKKDKNGLMQNIFLRDDSSKLNESKTIIAEKGIITNQNNKNYLILFDGIIQTEDKCSSVEVDGDIKTECLKNRINFLNFKKTEINLSSFVTKTTTFPKLQERPALSLLSCLDWFKKTFLYIELSERSIKDLCSSKSEIVSELNRRIGMPFYIPLIALIACYLLSSRKESKYFHLQKYIIFALTFAILIFAEIAVRYSGKSYINLLIYYFFSPALIFFNYLNLIRIFKYENLAR